MSQKQRLKQLEKKAHSQLIAFFVLPGGLDNRKQIESQLWDDYVKNGGNETATPAFLPQQTESYGFVCCVEVAFVNEWLVNNSAVALIGLCQKELGNKKTERLTISDKTFGHVPMTGLEPALCRQK